MAEDIRSINYLQVMLYKLHLQTNVTGADCAMFIVGLVSITFSAELPAEVPNYPGSQISFWESSVSRRPAKESEPGCYVLEFGDSGVEL
jgi:hypothetical protein